ncbi:MAG TPA: phage holin family protein [Rhodocyclaceae bacterium]|nr:phage holin family protein [Rhodocyclaceae bacterium]
MIEASGIPPRQEGSSPRREGAFSALKGLFGVTLAIAQNRLELLGVELAEERVRVFSLLFYGAIALVFLATGLVFFAVFLTVLFWETQRLLVLGMFSALFVGAGSVTLLIAIHYARARSNLFSASLAELQQDRTLLTDNPASAYPLDARRS